MESQCGKVSCGKKGREGSVVKAEERVVFDFWVVGRRGGEAEKRTRDIHVHVCTYIPEPAVILCMYVLYVSSYHRWVLRKRGGNS